MKGMAEAGNNVLQVRDTVGVAHLSEIAVLEITGPDAGRFLQNRLSNDVLALKPGFAQLNAALDRQGKIQGLFTLLCTPDGFLMLIDVQEKENALTEILKYRIVEQVTFSPLTDCQVFSIQGKKSAELLAHHFTGDGLPGSDFEWTEGQFDGKIPANLLKRSLSGEEGFLLLADTSDYEPLLKKLTGIALDLHGTVMPPETREILRVEAGLPQFGRDYDFDTLLPETGLERLAVSYSKGCYLGQETIARIKTYGMVQKALVGLLFEPDSEPPPENMDCLLDGRTIGKITSVVISAALERPIAMAYLGKTERVPGKELTLSIGGREFRATVTLLPFYDGRARHKSAQAWLDEGLKLFAEGFDEEAIRVLKLAIEKDEKLPEAWEALGVILGRHDRYDEAVECMEKILALDPDHVLAHTNLSVFYMKQGDKEKAEEEKAKATMAAFSKKAKEAGLTFDIEAEQRKKEQATLEKIAMFTEALKFNPTDPLGNFGLGRAYLELKRYEEAIEPFQKAIDAQPKHSAAYLSLGKAFEGVHQPEQARKAYEKGIEIAAAKGDLMPLREMQSRLENLKSLSGP